MQRHCLGDLLRLFQNSPDMGSEIARYPFEACLRGDFPEEFFGYEPQMIDDHYHLANQGVFTQAEADDRLADFLRSYAC